MKEKISYDYVFAQRICRELKAGNHEAVKEIHSRFQNQFSNFVRFRISGYISHKHDTDEVLNTFWIELLNGNAVCSYQGENNASLYSFLLKTLNWRVQDWMRQKAKERLVFSTGNNEKHIKTDCCINSGNMDNHISPEIILEQVECRKIFYKALLELEQAFPMDAHLVYMRLKEMTYKQIADKIGKKESAVKKQFTREGTGSMAKFKIILEQNINKQGISITDLIKSLG
ncbi:RNA polymerase sigma factor, sigma-70 family [Desulfonema limicola]|uniref:RNA polymerase sigma factor, sigma-70 family n=1 Tax=Desulfonema limicola TaxID=45656 RepID=A0A975BAH8_9BACT|nr:sigma-70 family RNA polymerase sigma factor [Desulfonema limicola]QTA81707.1 RNA polymerase sigma factor, sigma-70 family [Desulfonema limicola]